MRKIEWCASNDELISAENVAKEFSYEKDDSAYVASSVEEIHLKDLLDCVCMENLSSAEIAAEDFFCYHVKNTWRRLYVE